MNPGIRFGINRINRDYANRLINQTTCDKLVTKSTDKAVPELSKFSIFGY